jgi:hypothetical protein
MPSSHQVCAYKEKTSTPAETTIVLITCCCQSLLQGRPSCWIAGPARQACRGPAVADTTPTSRQYTARKHNHKSEHTTTPLAPESKLTAEAILNLCAPRVLLQVPDAVHYSFKRGHPAELLVLHANLPLPAVANTTPISMQYTARKITKASLLQLRLCPKTNSQRKPSSCNLCAPRST